MKSVLIALIILGSAGSTMAAVDGARKKPSWDRNDDERIAERVRVAYESDDAPPGASGKTLSALIATPEARTYKYIIDGRRSPELFMPFELLDVLLEGISANQQTRAAARTALSGGIRAAGYDEDKFWKTFEALAVPYLSLGPEVSERFVTVKTKTADGATMTVVVDRERCVARAALLQSARTAFGTPEFQQLLYVVVAPHVRRAIATTQPHLGEELKFIVEGCRP